MKSSNKKKKAFFMVMLWGSQTEKKVILVSMCTHEAPVREASNDIET